MSGTRMANVGKKNAEARKTETVEVLYQKMGDRWFAFSVVDEEIFIGSISQGEIDTYDSQEPKKTRTLSPA